jgi:hypothetical protein
MNNSEFWQWFVRNAEALAPRVLTPSLAYQLQTNLDSVIGEVDWEIGPLDDGAFAFFAVSPTSEDEAVNDAARSLIAAAPPVPGWVLRLYKPRRAWEMAFEIGVGRRRVPIEGEKWKVVVHPSARARGRWDVRFACDPDVRMLPQEALLRAAWTLLDGELGTEKSRTLVDSVTVSTESDAEGIPLKSGWLDTAIGGA